MPLASDAAMTSLPSASEVRVKVKVPPTPWPPMLSAAPVTAMFCVDALRVSTAPVPVVTETLGMPAICEAAGEVGGVRRRPRCRCGRWCRSSP